MARQPIENHGIIGNMRTTALVGMNGSIDWFCYPRFDSPSVFGRILDHEKGGHFSIAPAHEEGVKYKQFYWPETNVLVTRFLSKEGVGQITDYMPLGCRDLDSERPILIRQVHVVRCQMTFRIECDPSFDYARVDHEAQICSDGAAFRSSKLSLALSTYIPLEEENGAVVSKICMQEGQGTVLTLQGIESSEECPEPISTDDAEVMFRRTVDYWRKWLSQCTYRGRWREEVYRSALVLKLLTYEPTGAIVAAPTCSLPEDLGGERNWDYRFTWIRDAGFTLYALLRIGFTSEAAKFMQWLEARCHELEEDGSLQIMYGIDGRHTLTEEILDHLSGY